MSIVIVFAGGEMVDVGIKDDLPIPDLVIAADSGHENAARLGFVVDTLIGDMDSIAPSPAVSSQTHVITYPEDKDATDLELALEHAAKGQPDRIVLVGAQGERFDHELGAVTVLCSGRWEEVGELDWIRSDARCHVIRRARRINGDPNSLISLIPFGGDARGVSTQGLRWELDGDDLVSGSTRGLSNRFARPEALIRVEAGVILAVIPTEGL